jgi:Na+/proline symporter
MHLKVNARNAQTVIEMLEERFGDRWSEFVAAVKAEAK